MGLFTSDGADGGGFIHPVSHIDGMLFGSILRLYPLRELVRDDKGDWALLYQGGDDFLRQMLLRGQGLWISGLRDVIGFGDALPAHCRRDRRGRYGKVQSSFETAVYDRSVSQYVPAGNDVRSPACPHHGGYGNEPQGFPDPDGSSVGKQITESLDNKKALVLHLPVQFGAQGLSLYHYIRFC